MVKLKRTTDDLACVMRGIALALGLLANLPFLLFLVSSGTSVVPTLLWTSPRGVPLFLVLTLALLGYLIAWRWEKAGGATTMASAVAICALVYLGSGTTLLPAALMISVPLLVAGILFLACCRRSGQPYPITTARNGRAGHGSKQTEAQKA